MRVENLSDDLWIGVKGQSNSEIARTPRNAFRCSVAECLPEVKLLRRLGGFTAYQPLTNSECQHIVAAVSPGVRRSRGERGTTQTNS